jgi:hypothetical protein
MTLIQTIYLTLAAVAMVIGMHQTMTVGFGPSYWIFMTAIVFLMLFRYNRAKHRSETPQKPLPKPGQKKR